MFITVWGIIAGLFFPHSRNMMDIITDGGDLRKCLAGLGEE
ncbi:hypothetical protein HMPREF1548_01316 [Clostridium sp. KLE 1755]|nr:hypothetical protein HMPREF1548_01316 [Clostridium sp. KLE 1755]